MTSAYRRLRACGQNDQLSLMGDTNEVNFRLSFLDDERRVKEVWEADFVAEHTAICWMWMVGGVRALKHDWSTMELVCKRCRAGRVADCTRVCCGTPECCIARVPARVLQQTNKAERPQPRPQPLILVVEGNDDIADAHERMIVDAGFSVGASWSNYASAEKWLSAHQPDAAILDVKLQDKSCADLAAKLSEREIPFLAVSEFSANTPGANQIFKSAPWLEKPVTSASLHLALRSIL